MIRGSYQRALQWSIGGGRVAVPRVSVEALISRAHMYAEPQPIEATYNGICTLPRDGPDASEGHAGVEGGGDEGMP